MGLQGALQTGLMLEVCAGSMGPCLCRRIPGAHKGTYRVHMNLRITGSCAHGFQKYGTGVYRIWVGPFTKGYLFLFRSICLHIYIIHVYIYIDVLGF